MTKAKLELELKRALHELVRICESELEAQCEFDKGQTLCDIALLERKLRSLSAQSRERRKRRRREEGQAGTSERVDATRPPFSQPKPR